MILMIIMTILIMIFMATMTLKFVVKIIMIATTPQVIAMDNVDVALLQLGGTGEAVCQARKVEIETTRAVPMQVPPSSHQDHHLGVYQVDGEPLLMNPSTINIEFFNSANMLTKKKTSCKY